MPDGDDNLSLRILRFRRELQLTQQMLASFLGVSQRTVSRWERGVDRPSTEILARLTTLIAERDGSELPSVYEMVRNAVIPLALIDGRGRVLIASSAYRLGRPTEARSTDGLPTILVVEDDEAVLRATQAVLKRWHFLSAGATEGRAAVEMVARGEIRPDGAIIDFLLPGKMDGVDTARALRTLIGDLPILIVTGEGTPERLRKIADSGLPVVTKPIDPQQIQVALTTLLAGRVESSSLGA